MCGHLMNQVYHTCSHSLISLALMVAKPVLWEGLPYTWNPCSASRESHNMGRGLKDRPRLAPCMWRPGGNTCPGQEAATIQCHCSLTRTRVWADQLLPILTIWLLVLLFVLCWKPLDSTTWHYRYSTRYQGKGLHTLAPGQTHALIQPRCGDSTAAKSGSPTEQGRVLRLVLRWAAPLPPSLCPNHLLQRSVAFYSGTSK